MKFISKNSNLRIILKPGLPAQPVLGIPAQWSVSVKFQDGIAEVKDQKIIDKMLTHMGFNSDYIAVDDNGNDPFAFNRVEAEPAHVITEIKYGHAERSIGTPKKFKVDPEMQKAIAEMANEIANKRMKEMLPALLKETLESMAQASALKQNLASQDGVIASEEGDSSLLDNDDTTPTQEDFDEAELVELDDDEIAETLKTAKVYAPIEKEELPKRRAGRPSSKR